MIRDQDKLKERYQILLDNRQIFLFFCASAVILALVFSLGVVVGRRLDPTPTAQPPSDPLALLDRLNRDEAGEDSLSYHEALTGEKPGPAAEKLAASRSAEGPKREAKKPAAPAPAASGPDDPEEDLPSAPAAAPPRGKDVPKEAPSGGERPVPEGQARGAGLVAAAIQAARPASAPEEKPAMAPPAPAAQPPAPAAAGPAPQGASEKGKDIYTLQLSAFQDRHEAEQFMMALRTDGLRPYMAPTTIPDRGVWYRVRLGTYDTWEEALNAKQAFERKHKVIAYVARK